MELGLRHQGVILTAVRGCDQVPKKHLSKAITRAFRCDVLNAHCGDPKKSASFIEHFEYPDFVDMKEEFLRDLDEYPVHYLLHLAHASEVVGYYHPVQERQDLWRMLYFGIVSKFHMHPETKAELDKRLNADEAVFKELQG
jgi:hypothetical protein